MVVPPTVFVIHPKENRKKCSLQPLRVRPEFRFWRYHPGELPPCSLEGYVRLGLNAPLLSAADAERGLLVLDGTWNLVAKMEADFAHLPARGLPHWETAYPRVSKLYEDPLRQLATIEALFVAYHLMGRDTSTLLDGYRWANEFLARNQSRLFIP